jgi:hypothetical protein
MRNSSQAAGARTEEPVTPLAREAMKPASLRLILGYTMEDRRQTSEPTEHRRRRADAPEGSSTESDD